MAGKIFITSSGYDPECGNHIKDPYLDDELPSLGACRPDIRKVVKPGDHIFVISGKVQASPPINQFVMAGFEVAKKIDARTAFAEFPEQRLKLRDDRQLTGNVIVDEYGRKHPLDQHAGGKSFERRCENYIVGRNLIRPKSPNEIIRAREQTMDILCRIFKKLGKKPFDLIGRSAMNLSDEQVATLIEWLLSLKDQEVVEKSAMV